MRSDHEYAQARLVDTTDLSATMRRLTLGGPTIEHILSAPIAHAPAAWLKIKPHGVNGRAYTIVHPDRERQTLAIDVVLHHSESTHDATISLWASTASTGASVAVAGPRDGGFRLLAQVDWVCLIGDSSALPALRSIASTVERRINVVVIGDSLSSEEIAAYGVCASRAIGTADRAPSPARNRDLLPELRQFTSGPGQVWIAGEAGMTKEWRRLLQQESALDIGLLSVKGYWKRGVVDHRDVAEIELPVVTQGA